MLLNPIYLLYVCDAWKSCSSMRLLMASTIAETIQGLICDKIICGDMEFQGRTGAEAAQAYVEDPSTGELTYGYLEQVGDGECL